MPLSRTLQLLETGIDEGLHLGGQLYVEQAGLAIADLAFGLAREGESMTPEHLMPWLSAGKPVAAVAVAQLWERGLLDLDDAVARHIPEFAAGGKEAVTLRHLLTHTGGIRALNLGWPQASWDEVLAKICAMKLEPRWIPGRKAGYHTSSSWFVLGEVVRRLTETPFPTYAREKIFAPLGMTDCWIGMPADRFAAYGRLLAPSYDMERTPPAVHDWTDELHVTSCSPGAGGIGPLRQLGRFYSMLLAGGRDLLSAQAVGALTARHRVGLWDHTFRHHLDWGLGFIVNSAHHGEETSPYGYGPLAGSRTFGHGGYRSVVAFADPDARLVACLAVNGTPAEDAHRRRFNTATAAIYEDLGLRNR
jgi:CubicO group peptidase (beta-lactamase class C family)